MELPNFLQNILHVNPFIKQSKNVCAKNYCLYYVTSSDNKELEIFLIINNKMLEIYKSTNEEAVVKIWNLDKHSLQLWSDKKRKILLLKKEAQISHPKEIIEKISYQINIQKTYVELTSAQTRNIFRAITSFETSFYSNTTLDVNLSMNLGGQNHWLD